jgi:hypothetical protein
MSIFPRLSSIAVGVALYATGMVVAALLAVWALQHIGATMLAQVRPLTDTRGARLAEVAPSRQAGTIVRREAAMTLLNDTWASQSQSGVRPVADPWFGGSSRNFSRRPYRERSWWGFEDENDSDHRSEGATFRTVCVRLCDGYYFPISFSVPSDRLQHDSNACRSRCGTQGRLFVYRNPGGTLEDMQDLSGRPYRQLPTAFLYRSEYIASCKCQAHPWESASLDRHRAYALAADARKGNKDAAKELQALRARMPQVTEAADHPAPTARNADPGTRFDDDRMGLGGRSQPRSSSPPQQRPGLLPDWFRRAFGG